MKMKCVIFVHPTLSVDFSFDIARKFGYKIFSIITTLEATQIKPEMLATFSDYIFYGTDDPKNDLEGVKNILEKNNLEAHAIINGVDFVLYYTDFLQKYILNYPIDLEYSKIRMNKYEVNSILEQNNIKTIPSVQVMNKDDVILYKDKIASLGWPLIAKPAEGTAAMSAVLLVHDMDELNVYLDEYLGEKNAYYKDKIINKIILQKYIPGNYQEFVIDFVSFKGHHYCNGVCPYDMSVIDGKYKIYRRYEPLVINEIPTIAPVIEYVRSILDTLKVSSGFTHNEVFWDRKDSFYLVESNNRAVGNGIAEAYENVYGFSALSQFLRLLNGEEVTAIPTLRHGHSLVLDLYNTSTPNASRINLDDIKSMQKMVHFRNKHKLSELFYKNYTRADCIGAAVLLCNTSEDQLERDVTTLLEREKIGALFE